MSVSVDVDRRGIGEILHFTTSKGLLGILDTRAALSRTRVKLEERLEYILKLNSSRVLDPGWEDYVNLSISEINAAFFRISRGWHPPDLWWAILSFAPEVLSHPGVHFSTTNNCYPSCKRGQTRQHFNALFAQEVRGRMGVAIRRPPTLPDSCTTDEQAEVLYPERLSTQYLRTIYVSEPAHADQVHYFIKLVDHEPVSVRIEPERFQPSRWR